MRGHGRNKLMLAAAILAVATGCVTTSTDATSVKSRRPGDAFRPAAAPVPPTQEIEILDPNVDPTGKPTVVRINFTPPPDPNSPFPVAPLPPWVPLPRWMPIVGDLMGPPRDPP